MLKNSMIVCQRYIERHSIEPTKNDPPLFIDSYTVETLKIPFLSTLQGGFQAATVNHQAVAPCSKCPTSAEPLSRYWWESGELYCCVGRGKDPR
jgi:hypothetical protein